MALGRTEPVSSSISPNIKKLEPIPWSGQTTDQGTQLMSPWSDPRYIQLRLQILASWFNFWYQASLTPNDSLARDISHGLAPWCAISTIFCLIDRSQKVIFENIDRSLKVIFKNIDRSQKVIFENRFKNQNLGVKYRFSGRSRRDLSIDPKKFKNQNLVVKDRFLGRFRQDLLIGTKNNIQLIEIYRLIPKTIRLVEIYRLIPKTLYFASTTRRDLSINSKNFIFCEYNSSRSID
uniref:Uncharacterized protein n=1 Tax=Romanomermis culicivorax TaxID=13658 RepID=A0A915JXA0_ROMCU